MTSGVKWKNGNIEFNKELLTNESEKAAASKRKDVDRKARRCFLRDKARPWPLSKSLKNCGNYKALCVCKRQKDDGVASMNLEQLKEEWKRRKDRRVEAMDEPPAMDANEVDHEEYDVAGDDDGNDDEMLVVR
jgi:hypothetical protein